MSAKTSTNSEVWTLKRHFISVSRGYKNFTGGNGEGVIPEPIPNSEVKPFIADGTAHKSVGE